MQGKGREREREEAWGVGGGEEERGEVEGRGSMTCVPYMYDMKAVKCGNLSMACPTAHLIKLCMCEISLFYIPMV